MRIPSASIAAQTRPSSTGASAMSRHPWASATRWPARFPESTVETYGGSSTRRFSRSYQLKKCPRTRGIRSIESNARSSRSIISPRVRNPRSQADAVASSCRPMFVGDVRDAMTGSGVSWKLSGASQCVSAVTKRSK